MRLPGVCRLIVDLLILLWLLVMMLWFNDCFVGLIADLLVDYFDFLLFGVFLFRCVYWDLLWV